MSRLLIVARPSLVPGFQLAGVDATAVDDAAAARRLISRWLDDEMTGLLAVDEGFLHQFDNAFRRRMDAAAQLPYLALPSGEPLPEGVSTRQLIAEMLRKAVGFHITFEEEA